MPERITVRLPTDLLRRAERKAGAEGRTLASLIEDGLRLVLAGNRTAATGERVMPRVSTAGGGLMPGIASPIRPHFRRWTISMPSTG
jgi:hypothetical protein